MQCRHLNEDPGHVSKVTGSEVSDKGSVPGRDQDFLFITMSRPVSALFSEH